MDRTDVVEQAVLTVAPGSGVAFEVAVGRGLEVLGRAPGWRWARLLRRVEDPATYVLLVGWDSVGSHTPGFTGSPLFAEWRAEIGPFLVGRPEVTHHEVVVSAP